ncbi:DnaJ domain-containing protein [Salimicrobium flavidum]|uniref:DnaJ domain-containing protein n=1 Tax=Salimicrobium flavidum TaxID=570947 RepID=A0A1N7IZ68_9BACI|nr:DnaJ domain-containing protein [Salimicrobium flavidum]SIS42344.1 DnaJ domain-containing protein [Salimicrobium flavidum]
MDTSTTYYEMLEIPQNAPAESIKKAYVKKLSLYSSEKHAKEFRLITKAYNILSDPDSRKEYDEELRDHPSYDAMKMREQYFFEERFERAWIEYKKGSLKRRLRFCRTTKT